MSAGSIRRGPFMRPHPPPNPPSGRAAMATRSNPQPKATDTSPPKATSTYNAGKGYTANQNGNGYAVNQNGGGAAGDYGDLDKSIDAVYNANGIRLDRTPTDEEINVLWDNVRSCLNRDGSTVSNGQQQVQHMNGSMKSAYTTDAPNQYNNNPRHNNNTANTQKSNAAMNTKYIDGTAIAPQYRAQQRVGPSSGYGQPGSIPRPVSGNVKKVNMDTLNNFNRRQGLLNRKTKEQGTINYHQSHNHQGDVGTTVHTSVRDLSNQKPIPSEHVPMNSGIGPQGGTGTYPPHGKKRVLCF